MKEQHIKQLGELENQLKKQSDESLEMLKSLVGALKQELTDLTHQHAEEVYELQKTIEFEQMQREQESERAQQMLDTFQKGFEQKLKTRIHGR